MSRGFPVEFTRFVAFYCAWVGVAIVVQLRGHARFVRVRERRGVAALLGVWGVPRLPAAGFVALGVALVLDLAAVAAGVKGGAFALMGASLAAIFYFAQVIDIPEVRRKANSVPIILLLCGTAGLAAPEDTARVAGLCLLMVKIVIAQIYLSSGIMKLRGAGLRWAGGGTLRSTLANYALVTGNRYTLWLAGRPRACTVVAAIVLGFELTFWLVIPFPGLAWIYLPLGVAFHLGTAVMMRIHYWIYVLPAYAAFLCR